MRSKLIYGALRPVSNRYALCQLASQATRKFHRPNTRIQDTMNDVFGRFATAGGQDRLMQMAKPGHKAVAELERQAA